MENQFNYVSLNRKCLLDSLDYFINVFNSILNVELDSQDSNLTFNEFITLSNKIKELDLLVHSLSIKKYF